MSVIAESLNRIKKNNKEKKRNKHIEIKKFLIFFIYIGVIVLIIGIFFFFYRQFKSQTIKFPDIDKYTGIFYEKLSNYKNYKEDVSLKLKFFLAINDFKGIENILKNKDISPKDKLFYNGVILLKRNRLKKAEKLLKKYLKLYGENDNVLSYLGELYFLKNDYFNSLSYYNKIKNKSYEVLLNIAIIYELVGDYKNSIKFYTESLNGIKDPFLKKRIYNKLFILKNYGQKYN